MRLRIVGRILGAQALSSIGTSMSTVALAVMVLRITGSVLHMGGIMAASTVPLVVTAWVGGAFLDRYSARNIMVGSDLVRAVLIFSLPFVAGEAVGLVYVVAALMGVFSGLFNPGQIKYVSEVVDRKNLVQANAFLGVARDGSELVGYLVGGMLAAITSISILGAEITGYTLAFAIDAVSYIVSALLLMWLPRGAAPEGEAPPMRTLMGGTPAVMARLWRVPALRTNLLLAVFGIGAIMMSVPNSYVLAQDVFGWGALGVSTLEVFVAVGLILGGLLVSRMDFSGDKNGYLMAALVTVACCYAAVGFAGYFWLFVGLMGLAGIASVGMVVPSITMFQEIPPSPEKGRLIALRSSFGQLGVALGFVMGGIVGNAIGVKEAFWVTGGAGAVIALLLYLPYKRSAARRSREVWVRATQAGERRTTARVLARQAAYTGLSSAGGGLSVPGAAGTSWTAAEVVEEGGDPTGEAAAAGLAASIGGPAEERSRAGEAPLGTKHAESGTQGLRHGDGATGHGGAAALDNAGSET